MLHVFSINFAIDGAAQKKREELCQKIFEESPLGIAVFDIKGDICEVNKSCTDMFGVEIPEQLEGYNVFKNKYLISGEVQKMLRNGKKVKKIVRVDFARLRQNKYVRISKFGTMYLDAVIDPLFDDENGNLYAFVAQFQEITDGVESEMAFRERLNYEKAVNYCTNRLVKTEKPLDAFNDILANLVVTAKVSRAYIFTINGNENEGYEMSQISEAVAEGIKPEIDNPMLQNLPLTVLSGSVRNSIINNKVFSGIVREMPKEDRNVLEAQDILSILILPIEIHDKIWGFIGFDDCINERAWKDEDIHLLQIIASTIGTTISLKKERTQFESMYNSIDETIYVADPDNYEVLYVNQAAKNTFGEILGKKCYEVLQNRNSPCPFCTNDKIFGENMGNTHIWEFQNEINKRWYRCIDKAIPWPTGKKVRYEMAIDITKQKETEKEKLVLEEQLNQAAKMEAVGTLAGGIAHDFNNILTVIMGSSQLAKMRIDPATPLYKDLEMIYNSSEKAANLTKQLLAFSRKQVLQPKIVDINGFVKDYLHMLKRMVEEVIEIEYKPEAKYKNIKVDPGQLQQVIMNLAGNARDAMPNGGKLTIKTGNAKLIKNGFVPGNYVMLTISDTGHGMDNKTKERIFEPFFTTKDPDKGTGLGLATTYGIVKQSGGDIRVESKINKGTTFKIYFPLAEEQEETNHIETEEKPIENDHPDATIMVVEDEPVVKELLCKTLEMAGYTVIDAANVDDAIEKARNETIDCIITDIVMPKMSGPEMIKEIKSKTGNDPDVIYMSGYPRGHSSVNDIVKKDNEAYIQKPFRPVELLEKLNKRLKTKG